MSEKSILDELKNEIKRVKRFRGKFVAVKRLEALIRMRETQTVGSKMDIALQPGEWSIRGGNVEAIQHDGTNEQANLITQWVQERGGTIIRRFSEYRPDGNQMQLDTYLRVESPRQPDVIGPNWWVVKTADGFFFAIADLDFHIVYVPRVRNDAA